jgi:hypothetical protein
MSSNKGQGQKMRTRYILKLKEEQHPHHIGTKAHALGFLLKRGYRVPPT